MFRGPGIGDRGSGTGDRGSGNVGSDSPSEFLGRRRRRTSLHHDDSTGIVGEPGGGLERRSCCKRQRHRRHDRVAGSGHIRDFIGTENRDVHGWSIGHEERHAAAATRDEHGLHARPLEHRAARPLEHGQVVVDSNPERLLDFGFVRCARGETTIVQQPVPGVHEHGNRPALAAQGRAQLRHDRGRHQARAVVRHEHGVGLHRRLERAALEERPRCRVQRATDCTVDAYDLLRR